MEEQEADFRRRQQLAIAGQARLFRVEKGERIYYTDAEKEAHAARLRALIRERCS